MRTLNTLLVVILALLAAGRSPAQSPHQQQVPEFDGPPSADALERQALEEKGLLFPPLADPAKATRPVVDRDFIVFGYAQSYGSGGTTYLDHYRWEGLTHVGSTFITFDASGSITNPSTWTNRNSNLRAGGAAQAAGVKVIMVVLNREFDVSIINSVMTSATARTTLVNSIVSLLTNDAYCHGVSFDFEPFSWTAAARDGMTQFFAQLRTALPPQYEISVYADPTPSATQWDIPNMEPNLDYITYSGYDYATGNTPRAITDHDNAIVQIGNFYIARGMPPEKIVYTISAYSRVWSGTNAYGVAGSIVGSGGFPVGLAETTIAPTNGGPHTYQYRRGDEAAWYTWSFSGTNRVRTWDSPEALEYKIRNALSFQGTSTNGAGARLGGVGFWSLMWLAETSSGEPLNNFANVTKTRTYPHLYQLCQELLASPGRTKYLVTGFEGLDFRWRLPGESPDSLGVGANASRTIVASPAGTGRPASTTNAMQVRFDFRNGGANRGFFRHEVLGTNTTPSVVDVHAVAAVFDSTTAVGAHIHTTTSFPNYTVRMVVMDALRQLETSSPFPLSGTGWREIVWDLTDPAQVHGRTTAEPAFVNGNGVINTAGGGARDIAFVGFLVEGTGVADVRVTIDEVSYEHRNAGGLDYKINEFSYWGNAGEYVEVHGPAGTIPAGVQLRTYSSADGSVLRSFSLAGLTIPASGLLVIGDPSVAGVASSAGFSDSTDDLSDTNPSAMQLYNTVTGGVYDSVAYEMFGGPGDLVRQQTLGVLGEGWPWLGALGPGPIAFGRYPDGRDTNFNHADFSIMARSPGAPNGGAIVTPRTFPFESATPEVLFAYTWASAGVRASGVGASPGGGNVLRVADSSGGNIAWLGDAALGADGKGYTVTGHLYIPGSTEPAQALGVGFCGSQGTTYFTTTPAASGYESGFWLAYENAAGEAIGNGRPAHPGTFEFVWARNTNMGGGAVRLLGSATRASLGAPNGGWTTFELHIDPPANLLRARINGQNVYSGPIPEGAPTRGAIQIGHREIHAGGTTATEGTWVDTLVVTPLGAASSDRWTVR
jgi:hypothetical protein